MSNKSILINPALFRMAGSSKTKKVRPSVAPIISPNLLKNKLLSRIKEHKIRETENLETDKRRFNSFEQKPSLVDKSLIDYDNEFNSSINYLQTISKQKKVEDEKHKYEQRREDLQRRTLKNYQPNNQFINLELHEDLKEPLLTVNTETLNPDASSQRVNTSTLTLKTRPNTELPYGNLKNGTKPTYREWTKTQKNGNTNYTQIQNSVSNGRETKLNLLKEKIKQQKIIEQEKLTRANSIPSPSIPSPPIIPSPPVILSPVILSPVILSPSIPSPPSIHSPSIHSPSIPRPEAAIVAPSIVDVQPQTIRKTVRRQYTLGKSKLKNTVSVLVKNNVSRKKIIAAHKELKMKPINDVKQYLKEQNLIKVGSGAPNYMLRELYESSMLAGQIKNNNKDTMLHNLMNEQHAEP